MTFASASAFVLTTSVGVSLRRLAPGAVSLGSPVALSSSEVSWFELIITSVVSKPTALLNPVFEYFSTTTVCSLTLEKYPFWYTTPLATLTPYPVPTGVKAALAIAIVVRNVCETRLALVISAVLAVVERTDTVGST